ncbi:hypothetical protein [Nonomuraea glycinis]|uniref:hypothetical protein n=1 Tax=Nonomuraea glycinis TaxID=2047744 RepID=UPI002E10366B|nr:hypothetical protein OHA68_27145 [Nonomuraea glycinis]
MNVEPTRMLTGPGVLRVVWLPGSDLLRGTCHCGAAYLAEGPVEVWDWLLGHPVGHDVAAVDGAAVLSAARR